MGAVHTNDKYHVNIYIEIKHSRQRRLLLEQSLLDIITRPGYKGGYMLLLKFQTQTTCFASRITFFGRDFLAPKSGHRCQI